jgi:hypothetical protein
MHIEMQGALHYIIKDGVGTITQSDLKHLYKILTQYSFKYRECYMVGNDLLIKHVGLLQTGVSVTRTPSPLPITEAPVTHIPIPPTQHWGYYYGQCLLGTIVLG